MFIIICGDVLVKNFPAVCGKGAGVAEWLDCSPLGLKVLGLRQLVKGI